MNAMSTCRYFVSDNTRNSPFYLPQRLAAILYKAAELFSWVDPKVVQDILGVTVEEARAFAEQWDKSAGIAAGSALPSIEPPSMMALPGPRTLFAGSDPTQPQIAPVEPVGGRGPSNPGPDGQLSLVEAAETDAHRPVAPPADAVVTPDAEEGSAAVRRAEASYRGPTPPGEDDGVVFSRLVVTIRHRARTPPPPRPRIARLN